MLSDLCLGPYYYEAFSVLCSSLLLSSLISNSESWVGLTKKQISDLESVDEALFRNIFSIDKATAHSKTPLELFYLETGSIPIRYIFCGICSIKEKIAYSRTFSMLSERILPEVTG